MKYVVDTNVAVVANGQHTDATPECRLSTIDFLEKMMSKGYLVVDVAGEVEMEYRKNLDIGQPGVGNRFIQAFLTTAAKRMIRIELRKDSRGQFIDFPAKNGTLRRFDPSDRKLATLALKARCPVANAVDSDWLEHLADLRAHGIEVDFICSSDQAKWRK